MDYEDLEQAGPYLRRFFHEESNRWFYYHLCPACDMPHQYVVGIDRKGYGWDFNNNTDKPTFSPSMRLEGFPLQMVGLDDVKADRTLCHYFIVDGQISYCSDSPHIFAGKIFPLPMWPKKK